MVEPTLRGQVIQVPCLLLASCVVNLVNMLELDKVIQLTN